MRDLETIHLAIAAAETGVLVIRNAALATARPRRSDRIIDVIPEESRDQVAARSRCSSRG